MLTFLVVSTCAVFLSSCASLSEVDCHYADWYAKGLVDGANGTTMEQFNRYVKDCSRHGVSPDRTQYMDGRETGLESYCTRARGFATGHSGGEYKYVCPTSSEQQFLSGYDPGRRLHNAEFDVQSINASIRSLNSSIDRLERELERFELERMRGDKATDDGEPDTETEDEKTERRVREITRIESEIANKQQQIRRQYELKVDVMVTYRETVREVEDLGFTVNEKY